MLKTYDAKKGKNITIYKMFELKGIMTLVLCSEIKKEKNAKLCFKGYIFMHPKQT